LNQKRGNCRAQWDPPNKWQRGGERKKGGEKGLWRKKKKKGIVTMGVRENAAPVSSKGRHERKSPVKKEFVTFANCTGRSMT